MNSLDLNVLSLFRQVGKNQPDLPGVRVSMPPRRPARGRKNDRVIFFLSFKEPYPFSREQIEQLLETLEKAYYSTPGSVTSTMRNMVEDLNELILKHNLRRAGRGDQVVASFSMLVVRDSHLYMSQSGPGHGFLLTAEKVEHIYDAEAAGRGLGVGRNPVAHLFQASLSIGTLLVITSNIPKGWNAATLESAFGQQLKTLQRRFLGEAEEDFKAVIIETKSGQGDIKLIRTRKQLEEVPATRPKERRNKPARKPRPKPKTEPQTWTSVDIPGDTVSEEPDPVSLPITTTPVDPGQTQPSVTRTTAKEQSSSPRRTTRSTGSAVSGALLGFISLLGRASRSVRILLGRILPGEEIFTISTGFMALTAIAVPLIVAATAGLVYARIGRAQQFEAYYSQAENVAQAARIEPDSKNRHEAWETTLAYLSLAEEYKSSPESIALRQEAIEALDSLDEVIRLDFNSAIAGSLSNEIRINQMVAIEQDLYMLDEKSGNVYHAVLKGEHYEKDIRFKCGPGSYDSINVGKIVDIAALPLPTEENAEIVALDGNGNLLYCIPEDNPIVIPLVPPDNYWGSPSAITVENDNLYVLDPVTNAVWYYVGDDNYQFRDAPYFFFMEQVPLLQDAIDLAVDRSDLYILYKDGHATICTFSYDLENPTTCEDPALYSDTRQGRESGPTIANVFFSHIQHTQPPEPSLYFLDRSNKAVYHFSIRLNLVQLYQPQVDFPQGPVTAIAISSTRAIFLAMDNKVYVSLLP